MRVLQVVKTSDGAQWAAWQARVLGELGVEVHVVLPSDAGRAVPDWVRAGARLHVADFGLPVRRPWRWGAVRDSIRRVVADVSPDVIHSHFVTTTVALRLALGAEHPIPRIFQVPGPLHLEHAVYRRMELSSAGPSDYWVASSAYVRGLYAKQGMPAGRLFLSYYGFETIRPCVEARRDGELRGRLGIGPAQTVVGNVNFMYPPKYYLGQTAGLKRHEDVIDALAPVCRRRPDVVGLLVGGQSHGGDWYRRRLVRRARAKLGRRVIMIDRVEGSSVPRIWPEFDCAVHLPISENCGGVIEPLASGVPTVASRVGGLPEVVRHGVTGWTVPARSPDAAAAAILEALENPDQARRRAARGRALVSAMFDPRRTAAEVAGIYRHLVDRGSPRPPDFEPEAILKGLN